MSPPTRILYFVNTIQWRRMTKKLFIMHDAYSSSGFVQTSGYANFNQNIISYLIDD